MATPNPTEPYLADGNIDDLGRMLVALLSEVWVMRDRMHALEELVSERTGLSIEEIDDYCPTGPSAERLDAIRARLVGNVIGAPLMAKQREVEDILTHSKMANAA
jgi:hypothetical protein